MIQRTLLTAVLILSPLTAFASYVPLRYECKGRVDNISIEIRIYYPFDSTKISENIYAITSEKRFNKSRTRFLGPQHLNVQTTEPIFLTSDWNNGSEFFIDFSEIEAEYQGVYYYDDGLSGDYQIGIQCLAVKN